MPDLYDLRTRFNELKKFGLSLDLTRGKPSEEQLALSDSMLRFQATHFDGIDCRNYGCIEGLPSARKLFGEYLGVDPSMVIIGGNSSLQLMHDFVVQTRLRQSINYANGTTLNPTFICPVPGYDRHFNICQNYRIQMLSVAMDSTGPNMDEVERIAKNSPAVIGMWCVPKYSNPTGCTYGEETVERLAAMKTANSNFRIYWDMAYAVHDLTETGDELPNIMEACKRHGNPDRPLIFGSTSKITFAGGGVAFFAASETNRQWFLQGMQKQTIGHDKLNQVRHVKFLRDMSGIKALVAAHRKILAPKFLAVHATFTNIITAKGVNWTTPNGGYFINLQTRKGLAKRIVSIAKEAGVALTPAGVTFPGGQDPNDCNIRIAPSYPLLKEVEQAAEIVALATQIAHLER